ncbi:DUF4424 family protein [Xinfangfangia sp. D13-10-4-6]|uniref:DUF4424 family protein n=1 Tax=Pseudogemmobacter hezensis TaxID=2737662 RepID=UPI0015563069|nr:DUF4424 family protein [Pseudogemmobacter hezensis]NPD15551.1 DUF4424 family protein [Pseudogemmobacter hezensis]
MRLHIFRPRPNNCSLPFPPAFRALSLTLLLGAAAGMTAGTAFANDGFGGLTATGLQFSVTDSVSMVKEDLRISPDRISVDYVFRNITAEDVTGEVIFPLPPIEMEPAWIGMLNLPDPVPEDVVGFSATVDGKSVPVSIDRIAVLAEPWDEDAPLSLQYQSPGRDVTADLKALGIPLGFDFDAMVAALRDLDPAQRARAVEAGLAYWQDINQPDSEVWPAWSVVLRYHWTQTFPAGAEVKISHDYANLPPASVFAWSTPENLGYHDELIKAYCIDAGTSAAITKSLSHNGKKKPDEAYGSAWYISYVLRTANSWAGPIGEFRLTLDKGEAENVISLCADGVKKTGPTTFTIERSNYTPDKDLEILLVVPNGL